MSSDFKFNFSFVVEEIFELGNTTKCRCLEVRVEAQANGKKLGSVRGGQATVSTLIGNEHCPTEALTDFYPIISHEDRIVPNTIRKLDSLLTCAHDSNMATAAKQQ